MVRNALKDGLALEETLGANPFRFGFIGGTDTHNALRRRRRRRSAGTAVSGNDDSSPARLIANSYRDESRRSRRRVGGGELARRHLRLRSGAARPTPPAARGRWCGSSPATSAACGCGDADLVRTAYAQRHADGRRARRPCADDASPTLRRVGAQGSRNGGAARHRPGAHPDRQGLGRRRGTDARARLRRRG